MAEAGAHVFAWLATAWLHGLALFAVVWAAERLGALKSLALRETAWRAVLIAPLFSAALQVFALDGSPTARSTIAPAPAAVEAAAPAPAFAAPVAAAAPVPPMAAASLDAGAFLAPVARRAPSALGWAWIGWTLLAAALIAGQRLRLRRYRLGLAPVRDPTVLGLARDLRREAGLPALRLRDDPTLSSPIALAPLTVVLPGWIRTALSERQFAALLAHEVRHLARRDPQWRALTGFAALAALAPYGGLVLRRLEALAEHACDGWSARRTGDGTPLAECIAACLERGLGARAPSLAAAMAQMDSPLLERVRRLLDDRACEPEPEAWRERLLLIGALGAAAVALPGFAVGHVQPLRAIVAPAAPLPPVLPVAPVEPAAALPARGSTPPATLVRSPPRLAPVRAAPARPAVPAAPPTEGEIAALAALAEVRAEANLDSRPPPPPVPPIPPTPAVQAVPPVPPTPARPPHPGRPRHPDHQSF